MSTWNHRVVRVDGGITDDGKMLQFAEVWYDENDKPYGFTDIFTCGDDIEELAHLVKHLSDALKHPIIDESEFPLQAEVEHIAEEIDALTDDEVEAVAAQLREEMSIGEHTLPGNDDEPSSV